MQSNRRGNARASGKTTSNFLTQPSLRLNEIRKSPTFLFTTSNFLKDTVVIMVEMVIMVEIVIMVGMFIMDEMVTIVERVIMSSWSLWLPWSSWSPMLSWLRGHYGCMDIMVVIVVMVMRTPSIKGDSPLNLVWF